MFDSAAELYRSNIVAVIMTGMGGDGAEKLKIRDYGGRTIGQDKYPEALPVDEPVFCRQRWNVTDPQQKRIDGSIY